MSQRELLWFLVGPTGSGKTDVALEVAPRLQAEIISMDSMSIYRGMDIGTAKPTVQERQRVRHHLLNVVDPEEPFSVADYVRSVDRALEDLGERGKRALFVGGTTLYLKAMIAGVFAGPGERTQIREELAARAQREGPAALHAELSQADPRAAQRIHPNDLKRVIRALEVLRATGQPISTWQGQWDDTSAQRPHVIVGLKWDRAELCARIDRRVRQMFEAGLVEEVRRLAPQLKSGPTARQALGYAEALEHLDGKMTLDETVTAVQLHTRQFAKRQMTWLRRFHEIRWVTMTDKTPATETATLVEAEFMKGPT